LETSPTWRCAAARCFGAASGGSKTTSTQTFSGRATIAAAARNSEPLSCLSPRGPALLLELELADEDDLAFELEADLESLRVVGESGPLVHALELVTGAHAHKRSSWRHFATRDRVAFLRAAETDPLVGARLRLKLARWRTLGFTLFAVAALYQVWSQARSWNQDWLVADLRLGRFEDAARLADSPRVDPEAAALARRALTSPKKSREPKALGGNAMNAWMRGDRQAALEWLKLARLRGGRNLDALIDALENGGEGLEGLPIPWREALRMLPER